jgi:hypothetical protein
MLVLRPIRNKGLTNVLTIRAGVPSCQRTDRHTDACSLCRGSTGTQEHRNTGMRGHSTLFINPYMSAGTDHGPLQIKDESFRENHGWCSQELCVQPDVSSDAIGRQEQNTGERNTAHRFSGSVVQRFWPSAVTYRKINKEV